MGDLEEISTTTGGSNSTTTYYYAAGQRIAVGVNGTLSYLASDQVGRANVAVGTSGNAGGSQLVGWCADNAGAVLPLRLEVAYSPLYLWPH